MIAAELLKLRRNRGAVLAVALCAIGLPLAVLALDVVTTGTAFGGAEWADVAFKAALWPGLAAACAIGVAAGTADREAGVLRTLVATGCPRGRLLAVRVPPVLVAVAVSVAITWTVITVLGLAVHHERSPLELGHAVDQLPGLLAVNVVLALAGLGLGAAGLSSAQATTLLLAFVLGGLPAASSSSTPDAVLALLPPLALRSLLGGVQLLEVSLPTALAIAGVAVWVLVPAGVGAWRFARMEL
jgi:hypothetical protein